MSKPTIESVARELGAKQSEILDIEEAPAGLCVALADGTTLVKVPDDTPDVEGKTGWMFLAVPAMKDGKTYHGAFPVYAQDVDADGNDLDIDEDGVPAGSIPVVLEWVAGDADRANQARLVELAAARPRTSLIEELDAILAQSPQDQTDEPVDFLERFGLEVPEGWSGELREDGTAALYDTEGELQRWVDADGNDLDIDEDGE